MMSLGDEIVNVVDCDTVNSKDMDFFFFLFFFSHFILSDFEFVVKRFVNNVP